MTITVLSPHHDDAAFSIGLTIGLWLEQGRRVCVVNCFTKSEYCPFGDHAFVHANDMRSYVTALRHREDVCWSKQYRQPIELADLNLRDAPLRLQCGVDDVCRIAVDTADPAMEKIRRALDRRAADENRLMEALVLPLGLGDHVDHLTARVAVQERWPDGWPLSLPIAFYEDLPYAARPGAAEEIASRADSIADGLEPWFADGPGDAQAAVERKGQLASCYDSQIDSEAAGRIARFCERYGGRERLWVNDAWRGALGASR